MVLNLDQELLDGIREVVREVVREEISGVKEDVSSLKSDVSGLKNDHLLKLLDIKADSNQEYLKLLDLRLELLIKNQKKEDSQKDALKNHCHQIAFTTGEAIFDE